MTSTYFTVIFFYHLINKTVFVLEEIKHPSIFIYNIGWLEPYMQEHSYSWVKPCNFNPSRRYLVKIKKKDLNVNKYLVFLIAWTVLIAVSILCYKIKFSFWILTEKVNMGSIQKRHKQESNKIVWQCHDFIHHCISNG